VNSRNDIFLVIIIIIIITLSPTQLWTKQDRTILITFPLISQTTITAQMFHVDIDAQLAARDL